MISTRQADLVTDSFATLMTQADESGKLFYANLFMIAPHLKPHFARTNMEDLWSMFIFMVGLGVRCVTHPGEDRRKLIEMGRRHKKFGVTPGHYLYFRQALLKTLEQKQPERYSPEFEVAWKNTFDALAKIMIRER